VSSTALTTLADIDFVISPVEDEPGYHIEQWQTTLEQAEALREFVLLLQMAMKDGGVKRAAGDKPSWKVDTSHLPAIFSHLNKYMHGEKVDKDSGAHPLVHLACRALMKAWQEMKR
jgi:hypothetical protein